ncbi:MAG: hypothetical protein V1793_12220 [Pseudomonadota bacterium]
MISFFSSTRLAFFTVVGMLVLMLSAIIMTSFTDLNTVFTTMNHTIILEWILDHGRTRPMVTAWLCGVCLLAAVLFINTAFCSITWQLKTALKTRTVRRWSFFIVHLFFLQVLACHGISLITGEKQENITLFPGQSHRFSDVEILVNEVSYEGDLKFLTMPLKESRSLMTRTGYDRSRNTARIDILREKYRVATGKIFMLSPLKYNTIRITLTGFKIGPGKDNTHIGVMLTLSRTWFTPYFFTSYALMILSLAVFIAITWNLKLQEELPESQPVFHPGNPS